MNNLLKKLAEQAELPTIDGEWDYNDREILRQVDGEWRVATPSEIIAVLFECEKGREKFAELVIEELVNSMSVENSDLYHNEDNNWGCIAVKFWVDGDPSAMLGEQIQSRFADGSVRGTGSHRLNHKFVRYLMSKHFENKE